MVPCDTYDSKGIQAITIYKTYFVCLTEVSSYKRPTIRLCSPSERRAQIYRQCGERSNANYLIILPKLFEFMFVNDRYKSIGCLIPKTACSSWKFTMVKVSGEIDMAKVDHATLHDNAFMHSMGWRLLSTYSAVGIRHRLKTYFKFITVRHPFDRLVSAYKDKLGAMAGRYLGGLHARRIKQRYRAVNVTTGHRPGGRVTFAEFIRYVLDTEPQNLDVHWRDYGRLCDPCRVHYDYVVRSCPGSPPPRTTLCRRRTLYSRPSHTHCKAARASPSSVRSPPGTCADYRTCTDATSKCSATRGGRTTRSPCVLTPVTALFAASLSTRIKHVTSRVHSLRRGRWGRLTQLRLSLQCKVTVIF